MRCERMGLRAQQCWLGCCPAVDELSGALRYGVSVAILFIRVIERQVPGDAGTYEQRSTDRAGAIASGRAGPRSNGTKICAQSSIR